MNKANAKYVGKICPYCKTPFKEDDDIVVCSDCEMPHHKECWIENKGCTTFGCQGTIQGIDFEPDTAVSSAPKFEVRDAAGQPQPEIKQPAPEPPAFCCRCGAPLAPGAAFCSKCGAPVMAVPSAAPKHDYSQKINDVFSKVSSEAKTVMENYQTRDDLDPELGDYIGTKRNYYLNQFAALKSQKKYSSWNLCAFLVSPLWCMYRKMYIPGAVILGINFLLSMMGGFLSWVLTLALAIAVGIFANYFYMYDLEQRIAKGKLLPELQKRAYLDQKGGVNAAVPVVAAVIYFLIGIILYV